MALPRDLKKILIVDSEKTSLAALSDALRSRDFEVVTASRLETAEAAMNRYPFDIVIADIAMSGVQGSEGLALISYIRKCRPEAQVIVMTAQGSEEMRQASFSRGAAYYFDKPVDTGELLQRVCGLSGMSRRF